MNSTEKGIFWGSIAGIAVTYAPIAEYRLRVLGVRVRTLKRENNLKTIFTSRKRTAQTK